MVQVTVVSQLRITSHMKRAGAMWPAFVVIYLCRRATDVLASAHITLAYIGMTLNIL